MDTKGKTTFAAGIGVVVGVVTVLAGGDTVSDLIARATLKEDNTTAALRVTKKLCTLSEAERIGELSVINEALSDEDQSLTVACDAKEVAEGPPSTEEVEAVAAEATEEAEEAEEEAAAEVEQEIQEAVEDATEPTQ